MPLMPWAASIARQRRQYVDSTPMPRIPTYVPRFRSFRKNGDGVVPCGPVTCYILTASCLACFNCACALRNAVRVHEDALNSVFRGSACTILPRVRLCAILHDIVPKCFRLLIIFWSIRFFLVETRCVGGERGEFNRSWWGLTRDLMIRCGVESKGAEGALRRMMSNPGFFFFSVTYLYK